MDYTGKRVAVVGYGVNNAELVPLLRRRGASVTVLDRDMGLAPKLAGINHRLGEHYLDDLTDFDILFRTPGVPFLHPQLQAAATAGVVVTSQTQLFLAECPARVIGITGTKGKGTTASLIRTILDVARLRGEVSGSIHLAGNIGVSPIGLLDRLAPTDWVILELSSFQTQDLKHSPHIAVILAISQDHLDHHRSVAEYHEAKRNLVRHQTGDDYIVINRDSPPAMSFLDVTGAQPYFFSGARAVEPGAYVRGDAVYAAFDLIPNQKVVALDETRLLGQHNLENIAAATVTAFLAGATVSTIHDGVVSFAGLPFHLEFVAEKNGVSYYNDSFSTNPDATIVALKSFDRPIILIAGGSSKGADFGRLAETVNASTVKNVICLGEEGPKITAALASVGFRAVTAGQTMRDIVGQAADLARDGDIVLLSPGCASFGLFTDYKDRGRQFTQAVKDQ